MARPNPCADPAYALQVAELLAEGLTRREVADELGVKDVDTITRYKRDPRVKSHLTRLINERVQEVTRKVDAKIMGHLQREDLTVKELLDIRREFLGGALRNRLHQVRLFAFVFKYRQRRHSLYGDGRRDDGGNAR